jgi:hypothetical protein
VTVDALRHYREVWAVDFEFTAPPGHRPSPLCLVARELNSGRLVRRWLDGADPEGPPYGTGPDTLLVAYYSSAEWGCHLALGWAMPERVLDLFAEFAQLTAGTRPPNGRGLLGALAYHGLPALDGAEKESMRELAARGGPYTPDEREALLAYCQTDVDALARLLPAMLPRIDFPRALLRGRYMVAAARIESRGVPLDADALSRLRANWDAIKGQLVAAVNEPYGVFEPVGRVIDPSTRLGAALTETARDWEIDLRALADAVDFLWREERDRHAETAGAVRHARKATGLSRARLRRLEDDGRDHTAVSGLDVTARELAGMFPELGIGRGSDRHAPDEDDHAARLFDRLREADPQQTPRHDPSLIRHAAELVRGDGSRPPCRFPGPMRFSAARWGEYLARRGIPWPRLESGALALDDDTFREMAKFYPDEVGPIRELRHALGQMRLNELAVGPDGRNRVLLSAFAAKTGRNQPSNSRFIFGPSCWLRSLIRPEPGRALAYCDWSGQELGIAAALSGDPRMQEAYVSGDPYLWFGKFAGLLPQGATKKTHGPDRDRFKVMMLGVLYGLSAQGLARTLAVTPAHGRELMRLHREAFRRFWQWSDAVQDQAVLAGKLRTVFGWTVRVGSDTTPTSLRNFPMQANGAEMMRLAACLATERGIGVCCPVHDAFLIEAAVGEIEAETDRMRDAMREASELVLPGFPLRTDAKVVRHPDRYADDRGRLMWGTVCALLDDLDPPGSPVAHRYGCPDQSETGTCLTPIHPVPYSSFSSSSSIPL